MKSNKPANPNSDRIVVDDGQLKRKLMNISNNTGETIKQVLNRLLDLTTYDETPIEVTHQLSNRCPMCNCETRVLETRTTDKGTKRRRECLECLTQFNTVEKVIISSLDNHLKQRYLNQITDSLTN